uniref:Uncharacterized protein n=1 Tax=Oryza sativa subsp. japonica TaxID=39947 RepID=Q6ZF59_ORYSJ|nr:hypothetical protein [Oryza sativa Japonica Group]
MPITSTNLSHSPPLPKQTEESPLIVLPTYRGVYGVTQLVSGGWPPHESRLEHRLVALLLGSFGLSSPRLLPLSVLDAGLFVARFTRQLDQLVQIS